MTSSKILARIEANGRKLAVVEFPNASGNGMGFQLRDVTHGEADFPGTTDGIGRILGNPIFSLERAMREAHEMLFGIKLVEPKPAPKGDDRAAEYFSGNENIVGAGPERSHGAKG